MADRDNIEDILPLTPMQEMMLFQHELDRGRGDYWNMVELDLGGRLDPARWRASWSAVVARFPLLRTRFRRDGKGRALQIVLRSDELDWRELDSTPMDAEQQARQLDSFRADLASPPDLRDDPPLRLGLARTGADRFVFVVRYHHIVLDGWSEQAMFQDAFGEYDGRRVEPEREALPFGAWVRSIVEQDREASAAFWHSYLAGLEPGAEQLPLGDVETLAEFSAELDETALASLERVSRETRVTRPSILGSVWALTLAAESGCADLVIGQVASLRSPPFQDTPGPLIATLPLRCQSNTSSALGEWLKRQQQDFQQALQHASVSVAEAQRSLGRDAEGGILYALFGYEAVAEQTWRTSEFSVDGVRRQGATGLPLSLVVRDRGAGLQFILSFAEARYSRAWAERAFARFQHLLHALDATAKTPLNRLSFCLPGEMPPEFEAVDAQTIPTALDLVYDAAARYPQREAIVVDGRGMSYTGLQQRTRQLAAGFAQRGVRNGDRVGFYIRRGRDLIPAILGLWHLGAVYVPFDPGHPVERIRAAVGKADLRRLLVDASTANAAGAIGELSLINIDELGTEASEDPPRCAATDIAYLLFTSGSTGVPNGVPIKHGGLGNLLTSLQAEPGFTAADQMLASTTVAFDISLVELLLPICSGGCVHLATDEQLIDPGFIARMIRDSAISVQFATPALWENLLLAGWKGRPGLSCWVGGDKLGADLADRLLREADSLWNLYGPTETTICSTLGPVTRTDAIDVGGPVANTEVLVVDRAGRALPPGVKGELLIGGVAVSPGYVDNPELTGERFVRKEGRRFFRSGDLTLRTESGRIEHFGRIDRQIKMRGFRIEPGEIESAFNRSPGIEASHVMLREVGGDPRLLAYVVESAAGAATAALHETLPGQLPAYMLPAALTVLDELPLSASGKVDQRALPEPEHAQPREYAVPGSTEQALAELWQSLLGCPVRSPDDDFFALGGHSLLLARLGSLIQQRFDIRVSIRALMGATRLGPQAKLLDRETPAASTATEYGYLPSRAGLYYAWHPAARRQPRGAVLLVPPLLNDMIRTRMMYRELALNLQDLGYAVLRFDLSGHGNSAGQLDSLGLTDWIEDIRAAQACIRGRFPQAECSVVSARLGAALATEALTDLEPARWITLDPIYAGAEWLRELERWRAEQAPVLRSFFGKNEYQGFELGEALLDELDRFTTSAHTAEQRVSSATGDAVGQPQSSDIDVGWRHDSLQHIISSGLVQTLAGPFA